MRITFKIMKLKDQKGEPIDTLVRVTSTEGAHSFEEPIVSMDDLLNEYFILKEENLRLTHELNLHHNYYQCVPRSVMNARIQTLEEELRKLKKKKNSRN